jgi:vacuolar-type H+-ATPase subunit H
MKNLVERLVNEVGLNDDQARKAAGIFRDYLIECEDDPDLVESMKIKATHAAKTAKAKYEDLTDQAEEVVNKMSERITEAADKAGDKADEVLDKAKKKLKVVVDKISDYLADN